MLAMYMASAYEQYFDGPDIYAEWDDDAGGNTDWIA